MNKEKFIQHIANEIYWSDTMNKSEGWKLSEKISETLEQHYHIMERVGPGTPLHPEFVDMMNKTGSREESKITNNPTKCNICGNDWDFNEDRCVDHPLHRPKPHETVTDSNKFTLKVRPIEERVQNVVSETILLKHRVEILEACYARLIENPGSFTKLEKRS